MMKPGIFSPYRGPLPPPCLLLCLILAFILVGCAAEPDEKPEALGGQISDRNEDREDSDPGAGRWRKYRTNRFNKNLTDKQRRELKRLESIGYARGSRQSGREAGVTVHDRGAVFAGLNVFSSGHDQSAALMDMDGRILHRWSHDFWRIWPDYPADRDNENTQFWRRIHCLPGGELLVIYEGLGLVKLDRNSQVVWANPGKMHHDLHVRPEGSIFVLTREAKIQPELDPHQPVLLDYISILDADGHETSRVALLDCFRRSGKIKLATGGQALANPDIFHTNSLKVLDGSLAHAMPAFEQGNILISSLVLNALAVVDMERQEVVWLFKGPFRRQHDAQILPGGNLLLFDNQGYEGKSQILEFDPASREIRWSYRGNEAIPFYSRTCGVAQRLPNGNTLVTESDAGRAFELTADRKIVWEFINPNRAGHEGEFIATLFEMVRLAPDFPVGWARVASR